MLTSNVQVRTQKHGSRVRRFQDRSDPVVRQTEEKIRLTVARAPMLAMVSRKDMDRMKDALERGTRRRQA